ncbi:sensor histidine kinase [Actinophytocola sediminis]
MRVLDRFGRRYAAAVRVVTLPPIAAIALLRASGDEFTAVAPTAVAVAVAVVWSAGYAWWLHRAEIPRTGALPVALDVTVLIAVCLSVFWTDPAANTNTGWIRLLITFACVTMQWHTAPVTGAVAAFAVCGVMVVVFLAVDVSLTMSHGWVLVAAVLSRAVWVLVARAAARADRMALEAEQARRDSAVAAAERAEERELANSLHDTAATTLLMVGTGQVPPGADWLAPQARRDLARLRADGGPVPERADLIDLLRADLDATHLNVELEAPQALPLPFEVASALAGAAGEALNNVRRHAGTDRATVRVRGDAGSARVEIVDQGKGFAAADSSATRRGLRESIHGRLSRIGGRATVSSTPGSGTTVSLEWRAPGE